MGAVERHYTKHCDLGDMYNSSLNIDRVVSVPFELVKKKRRLKVDLSYITFQNSCHFPHLQSLCQVFYQLTNVNR